MNERIRKLYLQAHSIRHYDGDPMREGNPHTVYWQGEVSAHRFAELIVEGCANFVEQDQGSGEVLANRLKEHFGVEE